MNEGLLKPDQPKRGRGRPRKVRTVEDETILRDQFGNIIEPKKKKEVKNIEDIDEDAHIPEFQKKKIAELEKKRLGIVDEPKPVRRRGRPPLTGERPKRKYVRKAPPKKASPSNYGLDNSDKVGKLKKVTKKKKDDKGKDGKLEDGSTS